MNNNSEVRGQSLSSHLSRKTKTFTFLSSGSPVLRCQSKKEHMLLKDSSFHRRGVLLELASSAFSSSSSSSTSGNLKLVFKGGKEVSPNLANISLLQEKCKRSWFFPRNEVKCISCQGFDFMLVRESWVSMASAQWKIYKNTILLAWKLGQWNKVVKI